MGCTRWTQRAVMGQLLVCTRITARHHPASLGVAASASDAIFEPRRPKLVRISSPVEGVAVDDREGDEDA